MIITVFGATDKVGKRIVQMALASGNKVRAFGRNMEGLIDEDIRNENFTAIKGYVFSNGDVFDAINGCDVVLSALGGASDGTDKTRSLGMKNMITQMQKTGVERIIAVGGSGVLADDDFGYILNNPKYPELYRPVAMEQLKAYEHLKMSDLSWTYVCCPDIKDKDVTGKYVTNADYPPYPNLFTITAGNVASFMFDELKRNRYVKKRVGISDTN
jgi:putative NADH-flavin reductase